MSASASSGSLSAPRRPLHPMLVHVPVGGVIATVILDLISAPAGTAHPWARDLYRAGTFVLMIATTFMFLAILTGLADRGRATTAGTVLRSKVNGHALVMAALTIVSVFELIVRRQEYPSALHTPPAVLVLSILVLILTIVGGELGGRLTYRAGLNVAFRAPKSQPQVLDEPAQSR